MSDKYFKSIIGQCSVKSKLSFFLDGFQKTNVFPNCIFLATRGSGKTLFAREVSRELFLIRKKAKVSRPMMEVNCAEIRTIDDFLNRIILPFIGKEISYVFDECSSLNKKVVMLMLSMLAPNKDYRNEITYGNEKILIDFRLWTFMFCTTAPQLVNQDLRDRLEEISLESYSYDDLAAIIKMSLINYDIKDEVCLAISPFCRGNARSATKISEKITTYLTINNKKEFKMEDISALMKLLSVYSLGLTRTEVDLLRFMSQQPDMSLNGLAARSGLEKAAIQNFERYLTKFDLMSVKGKRFVTAKGMKYLSEIN